MLFDIALTYYLILQWVERLFRAIQPLLDARDVMPSEESRAAVDDVEQIIYDWNMFAK